MGNKKTPPTFRPAGFKDPAITYFRAESTIIGPKCLTAVFGMGTGVATWVCSPGIRKDLTRQFGGKVTSISHFEPQDRREPQRGREKRGQAGACLYRVSETIAGLTHPAYIPGGLPGGFSKARIPNLEGSFTLICLQRLSIPHVATQRCD